MEGARYTLLCGAGTRIKRDTRLPMERRRRAYMAGEAKTATI